jgi:hypothetical protein
MFDFLKEHPVWGQYFQPQAEASPWARTETVPEAYPSIVPEGPSYGGLAPEPQLPPLEREEGERFEDYHKRRRNVATDASKVRGEGESFVEYRKRIG